MRLSICASVGYVRIIRILCRNASLYEVLLRLESKSYLIKCKMVCLYSIIEPNPVV